jgi:hypothetical protein
MPKNKETVKKPLKTSKIAEEHNKYVRAEVEAARRM